MPELVGRARESATAAANPWSVNGVSVEAMIPAEMSPGREEPVTDSPTGWVRKHVRRYVESDGKKGHRWNGVATLLLTTRGRRTGKLRRTALIYGRDHDRYLLVASNGGSKPHPNWYQNLVADPHVSVQVGEETFEAIARTATAHQKPKLWEQMVAIWPDYAKYQKKTEREIPVVILERRSPEG